MCQLWCRTVTILRVFWFLRVDTVHHPVFKETWHFRNWISFCGEKPTEVGPIEILVIPCLFLSDPTHTLPSHVFVWEQKTHPVSETLSSFRNMTWWTKLRNHVDSPEPNVGLLSSQTCKNCYSIYGLFFVKL